MYHRAYRRHDVTLDFVEWFEQKYDIHLKRTYRMKRRFESTPSIKPVDGVVRSRYGWRKHPIAGKRRFHYGIDIASWPGAPIYATADGFVEYAGWSTTFGYLVVLNHGYGYRTLYAHCLQLLVSRRERVKKGQIIAQVGNTGYSKGNHLHYEVKRRKKQLNPEAYINLDIFTAQQRLW